MAMMLRTMKMILVMMKTMNDDKGDVCSFCC